MNLIVLLLALLLSGVLMSRLLGGTAHSPAERSGSPALSPRNQAQQALDAAASSERQRQDQIMKSLDPDAGR